MYIAAVFTIAKTWNQSKYLSIEEWIKMWYIYTMENHSAIKKKNHYNAIFSNIDRRRDFHTE